MWRPDIRNDRGGYTVPTEGLYPYQWNWDSAFVALGFAPGFVAPGFVPLGLLPLPGSAAVFAADVFPSEGFFDLAFAVEVSARVKYLAFAIINQLECV